MKLRSFAVGLSIVLTLQTLSNFARSQTPSWKIMTFQDSARINAITTNTAGHIFVGTIGNGAFRSTDNGNSWTSLNIDSAAHNYTDLRTAPNGDIYAATFSDQGYLHKSTNNGAEWNLLPFPSVGIIGGIAFDAQGNIYCCDIRLDGGTLARSTDGGNNWKVLLTKTEEGFNAIAFDSHDNIFTTTNQSSLYYSSDHGSSWTRLAYVEHGNEVCSITALAVDRDDVIYIGAACGVMRSTDAGLHWSWPQYTGLYDIGPLIVSESGIMFVARGGNIVVSSDKADQWYSLDSGIVGDRYITAIAEGGDGTIFLGTWEGALYRSTIQTKNFMVDSRFRQRFSASEGTSIFDSIVVRNHSKDSLSIASVSITIPHCSIEPTSATILAGDSTTFRLFADPISPSFLSGAVIFNSNSFLTHDTLLVQLFAGVPFLSSRSHYLDFGSVRRRQSRELSLALDNPGYDTLVAETEVQPPGYFQIVPPSFRIPPLDSAELTVRFVADTTGIANAGSNVSSQMYINSNSPLTPDIFYLTGSSYGSLSVNEVQSLTRTFVLEQNYPNPFNPTTKIDFVIPSPGITTLRIFDLLGRAVATLVNENLQAGHYTTVWDARGFSSGLYFYRLQSGIHADTKRILLLK